MAVKPIEVVIVKNPPSQTAPTVIKSVSSILVVLATAVVLVAASYYVFKALRSNEETELLTETEKEDRSKVDTSVMVTLIVGSVVTVISLVVLLYNIFKQEPSEVLKYLK